MPGDTASVTGSQVAPSDGTQNTGTSDGTQNTGSGQPGQPQSAPDQAQIDRSFRVGQARGITRTLRDLGFDTEDLAEAKAAIEALRSATPDPARAPETDAKLADLRRSHAKLERDLASKDAQIKALAARADVARQLAIQAAAVDAGVGSGRQAAAFARLYGDRFDLDPDGRVVSLTRASDGEMVQDLVPIADTVAACLAESPFLLAARAVAGSGSTKGPSDASQTDSERKSAESRRLWGTDKRTESPIDRLLKRSQ
jgi:hypothetical protein